MVEANSPAPVAADIKPPAIGVAPVPETPVVAKPPEDTVTPRLQELERQARKLSKERQAAAAERAAHKKDLEELAEYKRVQADKRRNPDKYLRADYGENYYDTITRLKVEGAVPSDLIASEMDERFKSVEQKLAEREKALDDRLAQDKTEAARREKQEYLNSAVAHVKANSEKYKLLSHFKEEASVAAEIQRHFDATSKRDDSGSVVEVGEVLTADAAAEALEKRMAAIADQFREYFKAEAEKAAPAPEAKKNSSTEYTQFAPKRTEPTQRRDDALQKPRTDRERWLASMAAGEQAMASRQH